MAPNDHSQEIKRKKERENEKDLEYIYESRFLMDPILSPYVVRTVEAEVDTAIQTEQDFINSLMNKAKGKREEKR